MTGPWFRRTALPHARGRLLLLLLAATWALFCLGTPPAEAAGGPGAESAGASATVATVTVAAVAAPGHERVEAGPAEHTDRRPCERNRGHHHCGGPGHHGVLGQPAFNGADPDDASERHTAPSDRCPLAPSREPGAARPPDLHQLQLLRV